MNVDIFAVQVVGLRVDVIILIKLSMKSVKSHNPEVSAQRACHALYHNQKQARRQIQSQRQQAQHTLSFLERQAKKTARDLERKQKSLLSYYQLKQSRFLQTQQKNNLRRKRQESLQNMRKTNSELRETSAQRRTLAKEHLHSSNKSSAENIKHSRINSERRLNHEKQLEKQLLKKRNTAFSRALELGTQHSKAKSFSNKRTQSSNVNGDLIYIQQNIKKRELQRIDVLTARQKELVNVVQKNREKKKVYDETYQQFQTMPFDQIYPSIRGNVRSKKTESRHGSARGQSLLI